MKNTPVIIAWIVTGAVVLIAGATIIVFVLFGSSGRTHTITGPDGQTISEGITATGEGKVTATPDQAQVTLGVENHNKDANTASAEVSSKAAAIVEAIKKLGVDSKDIQTINLSVSPDYSIPNTMGQAVVSGYVASNTIQVTTKETSKLPAIVDAGLKAGANQLQGAFFSFTDETQNKLEDQARTKATEAARKKAESIAAASGVKLGKLISSSEAAIGFPGPIMAYAEKDLAAGVGGGPVSTATPVEPGSSDVSISITVTYEID